MQELSLFTQNQIQLKADHLVILLPQHADHLPASQHTNCPPHHCEHQVIEPLHLSPHPYPGYTNSFVHFIHLEAECAAVIEIAVGRVVLAREEHQHVLLVLELLLQHDQDKDQDARFPSRQFPCCKLATDALGGTAM